MATAEELLMNAPDVPVTYTADPETEPHIVIDPVTRKATVPEIFKNLAVQHDHNIETITFDCPRYWDGHDMSAMHVYINYMRVDKSVGSELCKNVIPDEADPNMMHFDWTISGNVTKEFGLLTWLVCVKKTDAEGNEEKHWNSQLCKETTILEGLEAAGSIVEMYPDVIESILTKIDSMSQISPEDIEAAVQEYMAAHPFVETDPTVPSWAKQANKPTYTAAEVGARASNWMPTAAQVGADPAGTASTKVSDHNTSDTAHNDIRLLIQGLMTRLNALADSDDTTLDQMSEVVAYIKSNKSLIDAITTGKVNISDIINNLTTNVVNKPLSAAQGVALKKLIDAIVVPGIDANLNTIGAAADAKVTGDAIRAERSRIDSLSDINSQAMWEQGHFKTEDGTPGTENASSFPLRIRTKTFLPDLITAVKSDAAQLRFRILTYNNLDGTFISAGDWGASFADFNHTMYKYKIDATHASGTASATIDIGYAEYMQLLIDDIIDAVQTDRIEKTAEDIVVELQPNRMYVFPEMATLTYSLAAPTDASIANEYHFLFQSGATPTEVVHPTGVSVGSLTVEANKIYEISILENCLTWQSWEVAASA